MNHTHCVKLCRGIALLLLLTVLTTGCAEDGVIINGTSYPPETTSLDLSGGPIDDPGAIAKLTALTYLDIRNTGVTNGQYDALAAALPGCEILWTPLFQGQSYDLNTTEMVVRSLTEQDLADLSRFTAITYIDATELDDCTLLPRLIAQFPHARVDYTVRAGGAVLTPDVTEAEFTDITAGQLAAALELLPELKEVRLSGTLPEAAALTQLQSDYPDTLLLWQVAVNGVCADCTVTELDLSGIPMTDTTELESKLAYLPSLEKVLMMDCGISNEDMEALNLRHDDVLFVWEVTLCYNIVVRTDITAFCLFNYGSQWRYKDEDYVNMRYLTEMVCLDLGHQDITHCEFVAYMPHLKYLILGDTNVSDLTPLAGLQELVFLEVFMTNVTDYTPLLNVTSLEDLNISFTKGDPQVIGQMVWLDRLWWNYRGYGLTQEEIDAVLEAMPDTQVAFFYYSSTEGGWRKSPNYYAMRDMLGLFYMDD